MAEIRKFIRRVSESQGLDEEAAKAATRGLLGFVRSRATSGDFQALLGEVPGAAGLLPGDSVDDGAPGGRLGAASGIVGALKESGLEVGQVGGFVTEFLLFAQENVNGDLLERILAKAPELKLVVE